ncbi:hypothetical protein F3J38_13725 [Pantoea sp. Acro-805]|jgi:hypothetical protein|uniref:Uncharacterized protein n=1 Tax=Candidatus Pantoea formicae TaxID=2608355 RepID=A0ABX0QXR4_9GAMM|nr:hypothetical protein [Pantoea formicae]MDF7647069.1 hypothetical protein [Erwiniaceae bacterium L1_54_3]NIF01111.1 hypothetical protein [Pantoea formicae]
MKYLAFFFFWVVTVYYVWNGKDFYNKKEWAGFVKKFIAVLVGIVLLAFVLKGVVLIIPGFSNDLAGDLMEEIGVSFIFILGMKYMIVMICTLFSGIMDFHKKYNADNYTRFSPAVSKLVPGMLIFAKCVVSLGSIVIYYGIWLAN